MTNPNLDQLENMVLRNRLKKMKAGTRALIAAVEQYAEPKPGQPYLHRSELLRIKNETKQAL